MTTNMEIRQIYDEVFDMIHARYDFIEKPYLKIVYIRSSFLGMYIKRGFKYSDFKPVIKINFNYPIDEIRKTLIHEFCHLVHFTLYPDKRKPSHTVEFWRLCKEFELTRDDYYMVTKTMVKAGM